MNTLIYEPNTAPFPTFAGDPKEVRRKLDHVKKGQVVAVVLERSNAAHASAIEKALLQFIHLAHNSLESHNRDTLSTLVETLLPKVMPTPALLKEAQMLLRAKTAVLDGADWLTAAQVASVAGFSKVNPSAQLHKWKRDGAIFAIQRNGIDYYPGYGLDPEHEYRPYRALKKVIEQFANKKDGWGLAFWFQSVNSFLGGKRPMDLLASSPEVVIAAAADEAQGVLHG